jgi:uncharacterized protein
MPPAETPDMPAVASRGPETRRWRRWAALVGRVVLLVFLGASAVLYVFQTRLIFPGAATQGDPAAIIPPRPGSELVTLTTAKGDRIVALFGPALALDSAKRPTVICFYGNAMNLSTAGDDFADLRHLGANVMIPEYAGYGMSGGKPSEAGCYATADAAYDYLLTRPDVDPNLIVAAGWSLGGAVAIDLASRRKVAGLAVFSSFTSVADLVRRLAPFLPVSLLLRHKFESIGKIGNVTCPILIGHGRRDSIVPHEMSVRLASAAKAPVTRYTVEDADHNDFFDAGSAQTTDELRRFLARITPVTGR